MKTVGIFLIDLYKNFFSYFLKLLVGTNNVCRFEEHCDDYAKRMIQEKGFFKGMYLSFIRILNCQPFSRLSEKTYA